jgi:hypothetical protein
MDLGPAFAEKPASHRFPGAMAERVRELAAVVAEGYDGEANERCHHRDACGGRQRRDLRGRVGARHHQREEGQYQGRDQAHVGEAGVSHAVPP